MSETNDIEALRGRYAAARRTVMRLKGTAAKRGVSSWSVPGYTDASDRLTRARKALRKAEKEAENGDR